MSRRRGSRTVFLGTLDQPADGVEIVVSATSESAARGGVEFGGRDDDQSQAVLRDQGVAEAVVPLALQASMHATDGEAIGLVEVRDRSIVLEFAVLDDQVRLGPVAVHGSRTRRPVRPGSPRSLSLIHI